MNKSYRAALTSTAAVTALLVAIPAQAQGSTRHFDIPSENVTKAIPEFARQAGIRISAPVSGIRSRHTPAIKGNLSIRAALAKLIEGSGLEIASDDGSTIVLRQALPGAGGTAVSPDRKTEATKGSAFHKEVGVGGLSGRIINQAAGEYLRDATVTVEAADGHMMTTTSGEGGEYDLHDLPAGHARVTVSFIGYVSQTTTVAIHGDGAVRLDFALVQSGRDGQAAQAGDIVVRGTREGEAASIMTQRKAMEITDVLSTEAYGDIADGNPAEFLKYMPGVDVDGTNGTATVASLRGLPAQYTRVTLNGMDLVSANSFYPGGASSAANAARIFSFESISMSAIGSVQIYKTSSANQDADAPAGIIDLRTRHAYDVKKQTLVASFYGFTHEGLLDGSEPRSGGAGKRRVLPNGTLFYARSFFNNRLGVMASLGYNDTYIGRESVTLSRAYGTGTSTVVSSKAPYPMELYAMDADNEGRETQRRTGSLTIDFKANKHLSLSVLGLLFRGDVYQGDTDVSFTADTSKGANGLNGIDGRPVDPYGAFETRESATTKTVHSSPTTQYKINNGNIIAPSFQWSGGNFKLDGYFAYSDGHSYYDPGHVGQVYKMLDANSPTSTGNFAAVKGGGNLMSTNWNITQVSGTDWSKSDAYSISGRPEIETNYGKDAFIFEKSGGLNATWGGHLGGVPLSIQAGFKITDTTYEYSDHGMENNYTYTGPMSNAEFLAAVQNTHLNTVWPNIGFSARTLSGSQMMYQPDLALIYQMFTRNPGDWTQTMTAANYAAAEYQNSFRFNENIKAIYAMGTADLTGRLRLRAGLRAEWTDNTTYGYQPLSASQMKAAGYAVTPSTGIATTTEGVDYQFQTNGIRANRGNYFKLFPSASLKYTFGQSTDLQIGYSRTVLRPSIDTLAGNATIDDSNKTIEVPNPGLQPAVSDNVSVRLSRYFKSVGLFNVGFYYNRIDGLQDEVDLSADEALTYGNQTLAQFASDPNYAAYTFTTYRQLGVVSIKGIETSFQHSFNWLPAPFNGLSIRGAFMHNEPSQPIAYVGTNIGSAGVIYEKGPARIYLNILWNDDKYRSATPTWYQARTEMNLSGRVRLIRHVEMFFSINNLLDQPYNVIVPGSAYPSTAATGFPNHTAIYTNNGPSGTLGFRARF